MSTSLQKREKLSKSVDTKLNKKMSSNNLNNNNVINKDIHLIEKKN